jgi:hypothetical protein
MIAATVLRVVLAVVLSTPIATAAQRSCLIVDGTAIGGLRVGITLQAALRVAGAPLGQQTLGTETIYALRAPWAHLAAVYGIVQRVSTRSAGCRTARGIGPGAMLAAVQQAYASAPVSTRMAITDGEILSFPFVGTRFLIRQGQVDTVEVFGPQTLALTPAPPVRLPAAATPVPGASPGLPHPSPTPGGLWVIRNTSAQASDGALVVAGMVENRGRPAAVYAEARVFTAAGRQVAHGDAPLFPTPVPSGAVASFVIRLAIDDVVQRYLIVIRPIGSLSASLAEALGEIKDVQQFAPIIAKQLQAVVQVKTSPPTRDDFEIVVTNGSQFAVSSVALTVEVVATCRVVFPAPRTVQEVRTASTVAQQLRPGASVRRPLSLSTGICIEFATWAATPRIGEVRLGD